METGNKKQNSFKLNNEDFLGIRCFSRVTWLCLGREAEIEPGNRSYSSIKNNNISIRY